VTGRRAASLVAMLLVVATAGSGRAAGIAGSATAVSHGPRTDRVIALTFDDGVSPANCRRILAELVDRRVPATFFPMAEALPLDPAFWRLVVEAGDPIGDHTVTHPHMPHLSYAAQVRQMTSSRATIERTIGRPMLDVFRPPYGEYDGTTLAAAAAAGFPTVLTWDTTDGDSSPKHAISVMLASAERGRNGSVILMHCGPNKTPYLLPDVIAYYQRHGFRFVTVPELLGIAWRPGPTASLSQAQILDGVSPLAADPNGGAIVGFSGGLPPTSTKFVPPPSPSVDPSPDGSASPVPSAAGMAVVPPTPSPVATAGDGETPTSPSPGGGPGSRGGDAPAAAPLAVGGLVLLAALGLMVTAVVRYRRRSG